MVAFRKGDSVKAKKDLPTGGIVIPKDRPGRVTADTKPAVATVRVKFQRDAKNFRVVPKSAVKPG